MMRRCLKHENLIIYNFWPLKFSWNHKKKREKYCFLNKTISIAILQQIMWNAFWLVQLMIFIFRFIVMTTSGGIMDHEEARRKHLGGKILGFFFWECNLCTNKGAESILCLFFISHHIFTNQRLLIHFAPQKIPWNIVYSKAALLSQCKWSQSLLLDQ